LPGSKIIRMLIIDNVIIDDDLLEEQFTCNLRACKGACCWEGDWGAPLETHELHVLEEIYSDIAPYLTPEGRETIERQGLYTYYKEPKDYGTPLLENGACAYLTYDKGGVARCGIEKAFRDGVTDFRKPLSCHLYPVRVKPNRQQGFETVQYDRWEICSAACTLGAELKMPVFRFVKEALVRKYGQEFYDRLEGLAEYMK